MKKIVLDTSLFVNPASASAFGRTPTEAFRRFLELAGRVEDVEFYMPPSVHRELMYFAEEKKIPQSLLLTVHIKGPKKHEIKVPGIFLHRLVEDTRDRVDRGLRLAERHVREALQMDPPPKEFKKGGAPRPDQTAVGKLRENYRRIMREGALDSRADADLLLLSYELDAALASADLGVLDWADELGLSILPHDQLLDFLQSKAR